MATPSVTSDESSSPPRRLPRSLLIIAGCVIAWLLLSEVATEAWYRWRESQVPVTEPWAIDWPTKDDAAARGFRGFSEREMGSVEKELLQFEEGASASWRDRKGNFWTAFHLKWLSDRRMNDSDVTHNPTVCLPAVGLKYVRGLEQVDLEVADQPYRFNAWEFSNQGTPVFVFTATRRSRDFPEQIKHQGGSVEARRLTKLFKVFDGQRGNPLEILQLVVVGPQTAADASALIQDQLKTLHAESL